MTSENQQLIFILTPNLINALFPIFLKNFLVGLIFAIILFFLNLAFNVLAVINLGSSILTFFIIAIILGLLPLTFTLVRLKFTKYYFYNNRVNKEFRLIIIRRNIVIFNKITNINLHISIWDRLCNAGDLVLNTADDDQEDLVLEFISDPETVEQKIYSIIEINQLSKKILRT